MKSLLKSLLLMMPVFLYPPLVFNTVVDDQVRILLFLVLICYLLVSRRSAVNTKTITALALVTTITLIMFAITIDYGDSQGLRTSFNFLGTIIFAVVLFRYLVGSLKARIALLRAYVFVFKLIPILAICSFIFFYLIGPLDIFNLAWDGHSESVYIYQATPFGFLLPRNLFGVEIYRSFFFFIEPNYLGFFYAFNLLFISGQAGKYSHKFFALNLVGGLLTFSFTFIIVLFLGVVLVGRKLNPYTLFFSVLIIGSIIFPVISILDSASSLADRIYRLSLFTEIYHAMSVSEKLFGVGFSGGGVEFERHFSMGIASLLFEIGIINTLLILSLIFVIAQRNLSLFTVSLLGLLVFEVTKLPLFWLSLVVASFLYSPTKDWPRWWSVRFGHGLALRSPQICQRPCEKEKQDADSDYLEPDRKTTRFC